jgi:hypothetical protein
MTSVIIFQIQILNKYGADWDRNHGIYLLTWSLLNLAQ